MGLRNSDSELSLDLPIQIGEETTTVRVYDLGPRDGLTMIVLHGWGSSALLMRSLSDRLARLWRTVVIDFPGHGDSPAPPSAWGVGRHVQVVEAVAKALSIESCALIGHSNGGRISLELASQPIKSLNPAFLALISPSGIRRARRPSYYVRLWSAKILKAPFVVLPGPLREFGLDWLRNSLVWRLLGSSDYRALSGVMKDTFVRTVNHYVTEGLARISCPVLVFWGSKDDAITRLQMEQLVAGLPDAGLVVLDNAGHFGYLEQPDTIVAGITVLCGGANA